MGVELTRRNLLALLSKLDEETSLKILVDGDQILYVKAVEDEEHYRDRDPGPMTPETEASIKKMMED